MTSLLKKIRCLFGHDLEYSFLRPPEKIKAKARCRRCGKLFYYK